MSKRMKITLIIVAAVLLAAVAGLGIYVGIYYHADDTAVAALTSGEGVTVVQEKDLVAFLPEDPVAGFLFYPGGKVEHTAYAPMLRALAQRGILCVVVEMPFRLAVLDMDAADGIQERYPQVRDWYIGGHSLGGSMAASYVADNTKGFRGLILLAAYSTEDLSGMDLEVISLYGDRDGVLDMGKYEKYRGNLPGDTVETVIEGGNHAFFGSYGSQKGDGEATISPQEQVRITVDLLAQAMLES